MRPLFRRTFHGALPLEMQITKIAVIATIAKLPGCETTRCYDINSILEAPLANNGAPVAPGRVIDVCAVAFAQRLCPVFIVQHHLMQSTGWRDGQATSEVGRLGMPAGVVGGDRSEADQRGF